MDDGPVLLLRVVLALACVVGLIWVVARKLNGAPGRRTPVGPSMQVVGRQALGRHAGVAVLAVGNRRLLVGYGEQQVTMLTELAPALDTEHSPSRAAGSGSSGLGAPRGTFAGVLPATFTGFVHGRRGARPEPVVVPEPVLVGAGGVPVREPLDIDAVLAQARTDRESAGAAASALAVGAPAAGATPPSGPAVTSPGAVVPVPVTVRPAPSAAPTSPLDGSILSPATWRRAVATLQERTVRR
jgi:flagellar protein FliO/FliZ